jgi:trmH family RNA methyltransferase
MENKPNFETGEGLTVQNDTRNVIDKYKGVSVEEIKKDLETSRHDFHIAVENFQHDFNIGTIARNANAFNAAGIHIIGKKHWNRRGAMKTEAYMNVFHHETVQDFIDWAKDNKFKLIAIDNQKGAKNLNNAQLSKGSILVFGNESDGLSEEMIKASEEMIAIEQFGSTRSVNVGVASGILMYELVRRNYLAK